MHRAKLGLLATLVIIPPRVHAQTSLPENARVRVTSWNGERVIGRLAEVRGDTLVVVQDGLLWNPMYRIPVDRRTRVDISRGKYVHPGRVIGGAVLGAVGAFMAVSLVPGLTRTRCSGDVCSTSPAIDEALFVGVAGGVILGVLTPGDRWETVHSPVRVGLGGDARHARLGVSLAF